MKPTKCVLYEGKAKIILETDDSEFVIQHFKDDITAFNNKKKDAISDKGVINNHISAFLMNKLNNAKINTHFIELLNARDQLVKKLCIIPLEVVVRNISCGSFCKRFAINEGIEFLAPIIEFFYKDDSLFDPLISEEEILNSNILSHDELEMIKIISLSINKELKNIFQEAEIILVDFKIEFGKKALEKNLILADEITPDTCRLWCSKTKERLDKDVYRKNLGNTIDAYKEVARRLNISLI